MLFVGQNVVIKVYLLSDVRERKGEKVNRVRIEWLAASRITVIVFENASSKASALQSDV